MSALEETRNSTFKRTRKNNEILVIEPPKQLFRVVVNNFKQQDEKLSDSTKEINDQKGLPPQPQGYLRFPDYDWF